MRGFKWFLLLFVLFNLAVFSLGQEEDDAELDNLVDDEEEEEVLGNRDGLSDEERAAVDASQETFEFQAEVHRLMDIIINSLYSNREIFLRELISNAADACDKIRFVSLTDKSVIAEDEEELQIKLKFDKDRKTLTIRDSGIGMTRDDLKNNLGVVAKSGTTEFLEAAAKGGDSMSLIGQFGVGFYSVYLVADKVSVISKHNDDDQYIWESTANSVFTISKDPRGNTLGNHGTEIVLHLKEDAEDFADAETIEGLVSRYSQFINFPISLWTVEEVTREVPKEKSTEPVEDLEVSDEEDEDSEEEEMETITEEKKYYKRLNDAKPIWTRNPKDISEEEYAEFYKSLTKDSEPPLDYIHFVAEGEITFRAILYIPSVAPKDLYENYYAKQTGLKLYVRRVLISDEFEDFLPKYMNFIRGIVDSDDLPLNVSRETLAQSRVLKVMAKKLARKVLEMLKKMEERSMDLLEEEDDEDDENAEKEDDVKINQEDTEFFKFWKNYGKSIKMGVMDDRKNKAKLLKLLRYKTSKSGEDFISLEEYVDRMPETQKKIYFLTGESMKQITENPVKEKFLKLGYEILYMDEPVDEYCAQHINEFDGIEPVNVARESASIPPSKAYKAKKEELEDLTEWFLKTFGSAVSNVVPTNRLVSSPAVLSVTEYGWTGNMERIARAQAYQNNKDVENNLPKKIFEYNPWHPVILKINELRLEDPDNEETKDMAHVLFSNAAIVSGFTLEDPDEFALRINKIVAKGLNVDPDADVEEPEEEPEEDEEETEE